MTFPLSNSVLTSSERLHRQPGPCEKRHIFRSAPLLHVLQVVLFKLGERNKTLHHSLVLNVNLAESKSKKNQKLYLLRISCASAATLLMPDVSVYHAPLGVVGFTGGIEMDVFLVELSVVHVRFLHNLEKQMRQMRQALGAAFNPNIFLQVQKGGMMTKI